MATKAPPIHRTTMRKRRVRGLGFTIDDLRVQNKDFRAHIQEAVLSAKLARTMEGASTVTVEVLDPKLRLLRSKLMEERFDIIIDDLAFRIAGISKSGDTTTLTFEDREVAMLRQQKGAKKAYRDKVTRAEFILSLVREVKKPNRIPTYILELHKEQPIETTQESSSSDRSSNDPKGHGNGGGLDSSNLTVKGAPASAEQIRNGSIVLGVGAGLGAPRLAMVAAIMAGIQENTMLNSGDGFFQMLPSTQQAYNVSVGDLAKAAKIAYTTGFTNGVGLIKAIEQGQSPGEAAQTMEGSAYPEAYDQWRDEAEQWVDAYSGSGTTGGTVTTTVEKRYEFTRGEKENSWQAITRLAEEVQWRAFMSAGVFYYIAEEDMFKQDPMIRIFPDAPGVLSVDFDWDMGAEVDEVSVVCKAKNWSAPPGTIAYLSADYGPAQGKYLVGTIEQDLFTQECDITLVRPTYSLPEPAPETVEKTSKFGESGGVATGGAKEMIQWAESQVGKYTDANEPYSNALGFGRGIPWCSVFVGYGLKTVAGLSLPSNPAYSGDWLSWSDGDKVSASSIQPGDLAIYDWGDGGITDHVALYIGNGQVIGGNQSDAVTKTSHSSGNCVAAVRPNYRA